MKGLVRNIIALLLLTCSTAFSEIIILTDEDIANGVKEIEVDANAEPTEFSIEGGNTIVAVNSFTSSLITVNLDPPYDTNFDGTTLTVNYLENQHGLALITILVVDGPNNFFQYYIKINIAPPVVTNPETGVPYQVFTSPLEFENAKQIAESKTYTDNEGNVYTGRLAIVNSAEKQIFIEQNLLQPGDELWIGALRNAEDEFEWITGEPLTYTNWKTGEPSNSSGIEDAVEIRDHGRWNDTPSTGYPNGYIVEFNAAPVVNDQSVSVLEDESVNIQLYANDVENAPLTYTIVDAPANGLLSETLPDVIYVPNSNFNGQDSFTFTVSDGYLVSEIGKVVIDITPINDTPIVLEPITEKILTIFEPVIEIDLNTVFSDPENETLTFTATSSDESIVQVSINNNILAINAIENVDEGAEVTVTATDAQGASISDTFTVSVQFQQFSPQINIEDTDISSFSSGDIDLDGDMDLVTGSGHSLYWYENDGSTPPEYIKKIIANFPANPIFPESGIEDVKVFDMDKDGDLDLLVGQENVVEWYENDGSGVFSSSHNIGSINRPIKENIAVDLDHDGDIDVVSNYFGLLSIDELPLSVRDGELLWYENAGNGNYIEHDLLYLSETIEVEIGDINGDAFLDIIIGNYSYGGGIIWLKNDDNQNFTTVIFDDPLLDPSGFSYGGNVHDIASGDYDRDGDIDLAVGYEFIILLYTNNGEVEPEFTSNELAAVDITMPSFILGETIVDFSDMNNDGNLDVVCWAQLHFENAGITTQVEDVLFVYDHFNDTEYLNKFDYIDENVVIKNVFTSDLDGDGDLDVVGYTNSKFFWYKNHIDIPAPDFSPEVIVPINDLSVNEDAAETMINVKGVFDGKGETLTLSLTSGNEDVVEATLNDEIISLSYTSDQNGSTEISVTATNGKNESVIDTFTVTVIPVNDAPSFTLGTLPTAILNSDGTQTIENVMINFSSGPENEQDQLFTIHTTNDNPALFDVEPAIDLNGTLTYTPAEGADGTAIVSVTLMDDGGIENGGVDTSETLMFPITIESANAVLKLIDSDGNGIAGATAQYNDAGVWLDLPGVTDANGDIVFTVNLSGKVKFRMTYEGSNQTITQNIDENPNVTFQTVGTTVELVNSNHFPITDEEATIEFNRNGWQPFGITDGGTVSREMLPGNYNFRMSYANGSFNISQNIGIDPTVTFQTVPVTVSLVDSNDAPISSDSDVMFRGKEWVSLGTLDTGSVTKELLPASYRFRVTHASATVEKRSNVKFEPSIAFKTKNVSIELRNSAGNLITDSTAQIAYNSNGWNELGITDTGVLSVELLPKTYRFRIEHMNTKKEKTQNVQFNKTVAFQTIKFDLELRNSEANFITEDSGTVQFNSGGWNPVGDTVGGSVSVELLPNLYNFRMTYANASVDQKNDYFQSTVVFQTEKMAVELRSSTDELMVDAVGSVEFNSGGWQPMGDLVEGIVTKELLPKVYSFRMNYASASNDKKNDGDDSLLVVFNTKNVLVQLIDSAGYLLEDDFTVEYNSGGWYNFGSSNTGQVSMELLPKTYNFRLGYHGVKKTQKADVIHPETIVDFFTGQVVSTSDSVVQVNSGGWKEFTQNMELLPGNYKFKYADNSRITFAIEAGFINEID